MPFSPEQLMAPDPNLLGWSQLRSASMARMAQELSNQRREREQARQFDITSAEMQRQHNMVAQQQRAQLQLDVAKHLAEQRNKRLDRRIEGMKAMDEAAANSEVVEDVEASSDRLGRTYGIGAVPRGMSLEEWIGTQGAGPPPGQPVHAPPAGPGTTTGAPPEGAPTPGVEGVKDAAKKFEEASQPGAAAAPAGSGVTSGAATSAAASLAAEMVASGVDEPLPLDPADARTVTQAIAADAANPVVNPPQEVPPETQEERLRKLRERKPTVALEHEGRERYDAELQKSFQDRVAQIKAAGLSPAEERAALNMAAKAYGIPPAAIPPPAMPDPTQPPEAQGTGSWPVQLSPEMQALASAPPNIRGNLVDAAVKRGGIDYYDLETGEYLGTRDWSYIQQKRMEKRMADYAPMMGLASNPTEERMLGATLKAFIASGDPKMWDTLQAWARRHDQQAFRVQQSERQSRGDFIGLNKELQGQADKVRVAMVRDSKIVEMNNALKESARMLDVLSKDPSNYDVGMAFAKQLKLQHQGRATDADARLSFRKGLWEEVDQWANYILKGNELTADQMVELQKLYYDMNLGELNYQYRAMKKLYQNVSQQAFISKMGPMVSAYQVDELARDQVRQAFPFVDPALMTSAFAEAQAEMPPSGVARVRPPQPRTSTSRSTTVSGSSGGSVGTRPPPANQGATGVSPGWNQ